MTASAAPFAARRAALADILRARGVDMALISQSNDLYYLSGTIQQSQLVVDKSGAAALLVRRSLARARREAVIDTIEPLSGFSKLKATLSALALPLPKRVGLELDVLPYQTAERLKAALDGAELVDIGHDVRILRSRKDAVEIAALEKAAEVWQAPFKRLMSMAGNLVGRNEFDVGAAMIAAQAEAGQEGIIRTRGFNAELFFGGMLSGPHGAEAAFFDGPTPGPGPNAVVGQGSGYREIQAGETLLCDFAATRGGYICDGTRTFATGELPAELRRAHALCVRILRDAEARMHSGLPIRALFTSAQAMAEEAGLLDHFMGYGADRVAFLGHGVGLELDELPVLIGRGDACFETGHVVAVEPKFVFPGVGAVGVENTYVIGADGPRSLCTLPEDLISL